jgi:hypothetical protein
VVAGPELEKRAPRLPISSGAGAGVNGDGGRPQGGLDPRGGYLHSHNVLLKRPWFGNMYAFASLPRTVAPRCAVGCLVAPVFRTCRPPISDIQAKGDRINEPHCTLWRVTTR